MDIEPVSSDAVAPSVGPFSQAVRCGDLMFVSGQVALNALGQLIGGTIEEQAEQILANLRAILAAAGKSFDDVLTVRVFLTNMQDFARMNAIYAKHFKEPYPARTTVEVAALPLGAAVEMDLIARG